MALSAGERVDHDGVFTSRRGAGEGLLAQFRESTSSATPRSSIAVQSNSTPQPGFAGETGDGTCGKAAGQLHLTLRARA